MCDDEWAQFCFSDTFESKTPDEDIRESTIPNCPKASDLYISTKSKIGYLNKEINLSEIFWKIPVIPYFHNKVGVIKKQIKMTVDEESSIDEQLANYQDYDVDIEDISKKKTKIIKKISIGTSSKDLVSYRTKKKGAFYNCFVVIFRIMHEGSFKEMHVKIFNTGKMEIPGVPKDSILNNLLEKLLTMLNSSPLNLDINIKENSFETVLINSNFTCGFNIQRENLVDILKLNYKLSVSYDPCSYPGIMSKYYYYENKDPSLQDGRLYKDEDEDEDEHENKYDNSAEKSKKPHCISFMIFRTGSVLIVGKCNDSSVIYQIYEFIKNILTKHYESIYAINNETQNTPVVKKKKIKKKQIICYI